jgi:protein required for attachment to host cells
MKPLWTLIANAGRARLLQQEAAGRVVVLQTFEHPQSRMQRTGLGDDKAGRELAGRGLGGAAFEPRLDAQRKERLHFARELAQHLEQAAQEGRFAAVQLFASSPFLGELKHQLGAGTQRLLAGTHDVDLTSVGLAELPDRIAKQ